MERWRGRKWKKVKSSRGIKTPGDTLQVLKEKPGRGMAATLNAKEVEESNMSEVREHKLVSLSSLRIFRMLQPPLNIFTMNAYEIDSSACMAYPCPPPPTSLLSATRMSAFQMCVSCDHSVETWGRTWGLQSLSTSVCDVHVHLRQEVKNNKVF